ncbi:hypothetical protein [Aureimonas sp. ME7]|uniref:hypothetical protein n=1 Tax=Aureimonas sp. ME7 TaxID=2744252 RepID=UPI0015F4F1AD|nr:hypothetical protein [Aureimonas sp. ME7]
MTGSIELAALLRRAAARAYVECPDVLRPARGVAVGLALSAILWLAAFNIAMRF